MAEFVFHVESVFEAHGRAYVMARSSAKRTFAVTEGSTLGGCRIEWWTDQPRAVDASGRQRTQVFVFALQDAADAAHFTVGQTVTLTTSANESTVQNSPCRPA